MAKGYRSRSTRRNTTPQVHHWAPFTDGGGWEFLTTWSDDTQATPTWEPASKFFQGCDELWMTYILENGLDLILESEVSHASGNQGGV